MPDVVSFDVTGRGTSNAARFQVGQVTFNARVPEGGGLMQDVHTSTGNFLFTVGIAVFWQGFSDCPQCVVHEAGDFSVLLNGVPRAAVSFGTINPGQTLRGTMSFNSDLFDGDHEMKILITRPAKNHGNPAPPGVCTFWACTFGDTPFQFVTGISLQRIGPPNSQQGTSPK